MQQNENQWDRLLKIKTTGRDDTNSDQYRYPYEPTPYCVLERLANSGYLAKKNVVLDYGCGKGRADFFLSYQTGCRTVGVEYNQIIYDGAEKNRKTAVSGRKTTFIKENAETWQVPEDIDCCYFFNPFSLELLRKVMARIQESYERKQRKIRLFFYYPSDEYIAYLMTEGFLMFVDEIDCQDLFEGENPRERIVIFETD